MSTPATPQVDCERHHTARYVGDVLGDGVASPHTRSQLRYIQELKAKHGIDYDCHASYRFVERP